MASDGRSGSGDVAISEIGVRTGVGEVDLRALS